jgi:hypothetical protein
VRAGWRGERGVSGPLSIKYRGFGGPVGEVSTGEPGAPLEFVRKAPSPPCWRGVQ